jgi:hypothetical protein
MPQTDEEIVRNLVVVVARKADFLQSMLESLRSEIDKLSPGEARLVRGELARLISAMKPRLFVNEGEIAARRLNLGTRLEDLDRESLAGAIVQGLRAT